MSVVRAYAFGHWIRDQVDSIDVPLRGNLDLEVSVEDYETFIRPKYPDRHPSDGLLMVGGAYTFVPRGKGELWKGTLRFRVTDSNGNDIFGRMQDIPKNLYEVGA